MGTSPKRYGLDVKDDLELELRLRRIEAALEGKLNSNDEDSSGSRSTVPQVTGLRVTGQTPGSVTIAWNPVKIPNLRRYEVEFDTSIGFSTKKTFNENATNHTFNTASETGGGGGATWYARVRAVNTYGQTGQYSSILNLTTGQAQTEDIAPGSVTTVQVSAGNVAANVVSYDNSGSGLAAENVQAAIDEIVTGTPTPVFSESSTSSQTPISSTTVTIAHGLSQRPKMIQVYLICTTAEHLFSVGDIIGPMSSFGSNASFTTERAWMIRSDATNVYIDNAGHVVLNKGTSNWVTLTVGRWSWVVFCVA